MPFTQKILFLDRSGNLGGAELCLLDIAKLYRDSCLVNLFIDGSFRKTLEQYQIPVQFLSNRWSNRMADSTWRCFETSRDY